MKNIFFPQERSQTLNILHGNSKEVCFCLFSIIMIKTPQKKTVAADPGPSSSETKKIQLPPSVFPPENHTLQQGMFFGVRPDEAMKVVMTFLIGHRLRKIVDTASLSRFITFVVCKEYVALICNLTYETDQESSIYYRVGFGMMCFKDKKIYPEDRDPRISITMRTNDLKTIVLQSIQTKDRIQMMLPENADYVLFKIIKTDSHTSATHRIHKYKEPIETFKTPDPTDIRHITCVDYKNFTPVFDSLKASKVSFFRMIVIGNGIVFVGYRDDNDLISTSVLGQFPPGIDVNAVAEEHLEEGKFITVNGDKLNTLCSLKRPAVATSQFDFGISEKSPMTLVISYVVDGARSELFIR